MRTVAESEAEGRLPMLLDEVELGDAIAITRHGKPVAVLSPVFENPRPRHTAEEVRDAMVRIREQAKAAAVKFDWDEIKRWRDEGRH